MGKHRLKFGFYLALALMLALALGGCGDKPAAKEAAAVALPFKAATGEQKIERTTEGDDPAPADIVLEGAVEGGRILVYKKQGDLENLYGQYRTDSARYELGVVCGMFSRLDSQLLSITPLTLNGYSVVRINGTIGANATLHNYYRLDKGEILPFLLVDTGYAQEIDLDGDGMEEIVASHGLPMQTYVYSFKDGEFAMADVNEALKANAVSVNEERQFEAQVEQGSAKLSRYVYRSGSLIEA